MLVNETRTQTLFQIPIVVQIWAESEAEASKRADELADKLPDDQDINDLWVDDVIVIQHDTDDD